MPSPFPGMDPYLEAADIWPDFHDRLAFQISVVLNAALPDPYYARLEMRQEVGIVTDGPATRARIVPDVTVVRRLRPGPAATAVLERPRRAPTESLHMVVEWDTIPHHFVEIRDPSRGHALVTLIEILSPSNKRRGPDRDTYIKKQCEIIESDASLVEIDLLRGGEHVLPHVSMINTIATLEPKPDYLVLVSTAWERARDGIGCGLYPIGLREMLPCIGVPLKADLPLVPLDLQDVVDLVYDGGPYRRGAVDYDGPPNPPLDGDDAAWSASVLSP